MHLPKESTNLKNEKFPQIRLGLQGPPGSGKTWSALTFPNVLVANFDNGLTSFTGLDINQMPFYDPEFILKYGEPGKFKPTKVGAQVNRRDAFLYFLQNDALKMTREQTLVLDSWTALQSAFDAQQELEPKVTKEGRIDDFDFWARKIEYSKKVMQYLMSLKAHVVVTFHETQVRDIKSGILLDKIQPLMQGKFVAELKLYFTDFFRMIAREEKDKEGREVRGCKYYWQIRGSNSFDAKLRIKNLPDDLFEVEPNFKFFEKYI